MLPCLYVHLVNQDLLGFAAMSKYSTQGQEDAKISGHQSLPTKNLNTCARKKHADKK